MWKKNPLGAVLEGVLTTVPLIAPGYIQINQFKNSFKPPQYVVFMRNCIYMLMNERGLALK